MKRWRNGGVFDWAVDLRRFRAYLQKIIRVTLSSKDRAHLIPLASLHRVSFIVVVGAVVGYCLRLSKRVSN